jgi:hypothetical protein
LTWDSPIKKGLDCVVGHLRVKILCDQRRKRGTKMSAAETLMATLSLQDQNNDATVEMRPNDEVELNIVSPFNDGAVSSGPQ